MFILKGDQAKIMKGLWEQARIVVDLEEELEENEGKLGCYTFS